MISKSDRFATPARPAESLDLLVPLLDFAAREADPERADLLFALADRSLVFSAPEDFLDWSANALSMAASSAGRDAGVGGDGPRGRSGSMSIYRRGPTDPVGHRAQIPCADPTHLLVRLSAPRGRFLIRMRLRARLRTIAGESASTSFGRGNEPQRATAHGGT